jgi:hypothetical protein
MNDEVKAVALQFIVHRSAFIVFLGIPRAHRDIARRGHISLSHNDPELQRT